MAIDPLRASRDVNHDEQRRWMLLQLSYIEVGRVHLALDQAHAFLLESGLDRQNSDAFDRLDAQLVACVALLRQTRAEMAVECDPEAGAR